MYYPRARLRRTLGVSSGPWKDLLSTDHRLTDETRYQSQLRRLAFATLRFERKLGSCSQARDLLPPYNSPHTRLSRLRVFLRTRVARLKSTHPLGPTMPSRVKSTTDNRLRNGP